MTFNARRSGNSSQIIKVFLTLAVVVFLASCVTAQDSSKQDSSKSTGGPPPFFDYSMQHPGTMHKITVADLPAPMEDQSVQNDAHIVPRPHGAWPQAPAGFKVDLYANDLDNPRLIRTAPNGDLFLAESKSGKIRVLRGENKDGRADQIEVFASGLDHPFGIAFYPLGPNPKWIYVANTTSVVRFPYKNGDTKARGAAQTIVAQLPGYAQLRGGGHWTRDVVFSKNGKQMFISVGSHSNVDDPDTHPEEFHRADVLEFTPEGKFIKIYASGIRNCVGEAINPTTGELWCSVNERDRLGNNLVPDYITHVQKGGFYGWPWWYIGGHQDPRLEGKHSELKEKTIVPDILLQPHFASLEMLFYEGDQFPSEYKGDGFAAEHGSWNREPRAGYEVIRVPMKDGHATGEFEDFLTGFVTDDGKVWGRPVGVTVGQDGSLFVTDDGSKSIWHVSHVGQ